MSRTETLMLSQTDEMPLVNEYILDEIESLNAIYGDGTLCVNKVKADGIETFFRIPAALKTDQLTYCLKFPNKYPDSPPEYLYANVGLFETLDRRIQNIGLLIFLLLDQVYVPGNVCMFDLIELLVRIISCFEGLVLNPKMVSERCPELSGKDWRWMSKPFINMNTYKDVGAECFICCDEDYSFRMIQVSCKHNYCYDCLQTGWDLALDAGEVYSCCKISIPVEVLCVYTTATKETYAEYMRMIHEKTTFNPFYCGNRKCTTLIGSLNLWALSRGSMKANGVVCPKCSWRTCTVCRAPKHAGKCVVEEDLIELFKRADIRRCPECGIAIQKNGGCAHIQCRRCNKHFWWQEDGSLGAYNGPIYELNGRR